MATEIQHPMPARLACKAKPRIKRQYKGGEATDRVEQDPVTGVDLCQVQSLLLSPLIGITDATVLLPATAADDLAVGSVIDIQGPMVVTLTGGDFGQIRCRVHGVTEVARVGDLEQLLKTATAQSPAPSKTGRAREASQ